MIWWLLVGLLELVVVEVFVDEKKVLDGFYAYYLYTVRRGRLLV